VLVGGDDRGRLVAVRLRQWLKSEIQIALLSATIPAEEIDCFLTNSRFAGVDRLPPCLRLTLFHAELRGKAPLALRDHRLYADVESSRRSREAVLTADPGFRAETKPLNSRSKSPGC